MLRTELINPDLICPSTYQLLRNSSGDSGPDLSFDKSASLKRLFGLAHANLVAVSKLYFSFGCSGGDYTSSPWKADRGHNTNDCYQLKKQIDEVVASGKLAYLVKDICRNNQQSESHGRNTIKVINMIREGGNCKRPFEEGRSGLTDELTFSAIPRNQLTDEPIVLEGIIEGNQVRRILVDGGSSSEIMYEHCFRDLDVNIRSKLRRCRAQMVGFSGETYHPLGVTHLRVTMGRERRSKTVLIEFAIIKCRSSYNVIIGRTRLKSLRAVGSTIHSMIKFPTNQEIVTMETSREALWEYIQRKRVQGLWKE
ncbi:reverse transcriptase domain-containing protein, partial [Tanacetum coccineum]